MAVQAPQGNLSSPTPSSDSDDNDDQDDDQPGDGPDQTPNSNSYDDGSAADEYQSEPDASDSENNSIISTPPTQQWLNVEIPSDALLGNRFPIIIRTAVDFTGQERTNLLNKHFNDADARKILYVIENCLLENKQIVQHFKCPSNLFSLFCKANGVSAQDIKRRQLEQLFNALHPIWRETPEKYLEKKHVINLALEHNIARITNTSSASLAKLLGKDKDKSISLEKTAAIQAEWENGATFHQLRERFKPISYEQIFRIVDPQDRFSNNQEFLDAVKVLKEQKQEKEDLFQKSAERNAKLAQTIKTRHGRSEILAKEGLNSDPKKIQTKQLNRTYYDSRNEKRRLKRMEDREPSPSRKKKLK